MNINVGQLRGFLKKKTVVYLVQRLKNLGYRRVKRERKDALISNIIFHFTIRILQRKWRNIKSTDPVTLEEICYPCWNKHINSTRIYYNLETVVNHIIINGPQAKDPMTRIEYNDRELKELDYLYKYYEYSTKYRSKNLSRVIKDVEYYKTLKYNNERIDVIRDDIFTILHLALDEIETYLKNIKKESESENSDIQEQDNFNFFPLHGLQIIDSESDSDESILIIYNGPPPEVSYPLNSPQMARSVLGHAIHIMQDTYTYFCMLKDISQYWFDATFKFIIQKVKQSKNPDAYQVRKKFLEFIDHLRLLSMNFNYN